MQRFDFNDNWKVRRLDSDEPWSDVTLPHDAMIFEKRSAESAGGTNTGWFVCADYEYCKTFVLPSDCDGKDVFLEFEGVYRNAEVYVNGNKAAYRPYGYIGFYVDITAFVRFSGENTVRVVARNADQPNSRWYSGTGVYRPVTLWVADKRRLSLNGVKIRTPSVNPPVVEVGVTTTVDGEVSAEILYEGATVASATMQTHDRHATFVFTPEEAHLWTADSPCLYECKVTFEDDVCMERFGIRTVSVSADKGFLLNGERVILRGACIHHDNGILGARCYREAEFRKIAILKENGYNAVRSAHNPCSKALLEACDSLGMMVMDEYCDMWYIHKTMHDYADYTEEWYERDLTDMIDKDFNHPSVIMYSMGNEVAETASKRGVAFFSAMRDVCKAADPDRPVTCGVNIFFNLLHSMGFGIYSDKKAEQNPQRKVGSEFFNNLAGMLGAGFMKRMATLHGCDVKTRDCYAAMDVAGYNYGILRYKKDVKKYPDRVIVGSETFCSDAYAFWEFAKKHTAVIGDFVWAGMDYLGEVGVGSWEYKQYAPQFTHGVGWISAGSGRVDLVGNALGEALYTKVAFELTDKPQIAVVPVCATKQKHSPSAWKFSNALPSWSWNGLDGAKAKVEVYSRAPSVALYINGKKVGQKKFGKNCRFNFNVTYRGGEICAVNLDAQGNELARNSLFTAGEETCLKLLPEKALVKKGEICFVALRYTDAAGTVKPLERGVSTITVEGGQLLAVGSACPYNEMGFNCGKTDVYYGQAMVVVKALSDKVEIRADDGKRQGVCVLTAV